MDNPCIDCAMRLFNKQHYNLNGVGNPFMGKVIIIPNVDYSAAKKSSMMFSEQVAIIKHAISSTGELENVFILPLIRCKEYKKYPINTDIIERCTQYLKQDILKYDWHNIMLCGITSTMLLKTPLKENIDKVYISKNNRRYFFNYNPFIKYNNKELFEVFKEKLCNFVYNQ